MPWKIYNKFGIGAIDFQIEQLPIEKIQKDKLFKAFRLGSGFYGYHPIYGWLRFSKNGIQQKRPSKKQDVKLPLNWLTYAKISKMENKKMRNSIQNYKVGHLSKIENEFGSNPSKSDIEKYLKRNNVDKVVANGIRRYFRNTIKESTKKFEFILPPGKLGDYGYSLLKKQKFNFLFDKKTRTVKFKTGAEYHRAGKYLDANFSKYNYDWDANTGRNFNKYSDHKLKEGLVDMKEVKIVERAMTNFIIHYAKKLNKSPQRILDDINVLMKLGLLKKKFQGI